MGLDSRRSRHRCGRRGHVNARTLTESALAGCARTSDLNTNGRSTRLASRTDAEKELAARQERREHIKLRPLSREEQARYSREWQSTQEQFVDSPAAAVVSADKLIQAVMVDQGIPDEGRF